MLIKMAAAALPNVEWFTPSKGKPLLAIHSYLFENIGKGKHPGVQYWKCSCKTTDCNVKASTSGSNMNVPSIEII
jgi:FLYWCH zinc finger domain